MNDVRHTYHKIPDSDYDIHKVSEYLSIGTRLMRTATRMAGAEKN